MASFFNLGVLLCQALNLDPDRVSRLNLTIWPGNNVRLDVEYLPAVSFEERDKVAAALAPIVEHYKLVPIEEEAEHGPDS